MSLSLLYFRKQPVYEVDKNRYLSHQLTIAACLAPILEKKVCKRPLNYFKRNRCFDVLFYPIAMLNRIHHIANFDANRPLMLLSPLPLTLQADASLLLWNYRIRLKPPRAMLMRAPYNFIPIGPVILLCYLEIPLL